MAIFDKIDKIIEVLDDAGIEDLKSIIDNDFDPIPTDEYPTCVVLPTKTNTIKNVFGMRLAEDLITITVFEYVIQKSDVSTARRTAKRLFDIVMSTISEKINFFATSDVEYIETVFGKSRITGVMVTIKINQ